MHEMSFSFNHSLRFQEAWLDTIAVIKASSTFVIGLLDTKFGLDHYDIEMAFIVQMHIWYCNIKIGTVNVINCLQETFFGRNISNVSETP